METNTCKLELYSKKFSLDFLDLTISESTLDNVVENITSSLKERASFSTSVENSSEDLETFEDSIVQRLIPEIIRKLESPKNKGGLGITFSPMGLSKILKQLRDALLPKTETKEDEKDPVPATNTPEDNRKKKLEDLNLRLLRNKIFKGSPLLSLFHDTQFSRELRLVIIFDSRKENRQLVYDLRTLNENILSYKQRLYEQIYDYCKANGIDVPTRRSYYNKDGSVNSKAEEVLEKFYKYLNEMEDSLRLAYLEKSWEDITLNKNNKQVNILLAANAYITLLQFNDLVKRVAGNYIAFDKDVDEPINIIEVNNNKTIKYKYNFGRRLSNLQKDFRDVIQNALDTMGNFSKFLIESIPKIDSGENLNQILYINALLHFKEAVRKLPKDDSDVKKYTQYLSLLHKNPKESWKILLTNFVNENNFDKFTKQGLTSEDIIILKSIQRFIYGKSAEEKKNSLYTLEQEIHRQFGLKEIYSLVDTLLSTIDSISQLNYLEYTWDYKTQQPTVRIKKKYFNNKQKMDLIDGINHEASKPLSDNIKQKYKISYLGGPFTAKIGNKTIFIKPKEYSEYGIFDKDLEITYDGLPIDKYFKDIDLTGTGNRSSVLNSLPGSKEYELLSVLKFIDGALLTGLSINNESLQKYFIYNTLLNKGLEQLLLAACKTYLVKDIQRKFKNDIDKGSINPTTGKPYNIRDLHDWIKYNQSQVPIRLFIRQENEYNKKFFGTQLGIPFIKPIQHDEVWIDNLSDALAILVGDALKATTKNVDGENIPNYSPAFLGEDIWEVMARNSENPTTGVLLFSNNSYAIKNVIIDTDVRMYDGSRKQTKNMTEAELLYHFFVNKFVIPFSKKSKSYRSFISQPTVYSDKSKFVEYDVSLDDLDVNIKDDGEIIEAIRNSLGKYHKRVCDKVLSDYGKILGLSNPTFEQVQRLLDVTNLKELNILVDEYNKNHEDKVELLEHLHYRELKGKLYLNEILIYKSLNLYGSNLTSTLRNATVEYVNLLLNSGTVINTSVFSDMLKEMANEFNVKLKDWVDSNGNLIFAKLTLEDGTVVDIVGGENALSDNKGLIINPLILKYVLLHNLINNNLKEGLFGIEYVHKIKAKLAELKVEEKISLGLDGTNSVSLGEALLKVNEKLNNEINNPEPDLDSIKYFADLLTKIVSQIQLMEQTSEIALLKRTVTGPGTMTYYLQGTLSGILPTERAAIIRDVNANVYNFEGETKTNLEAHDGSAWLCPITAIYQNNSLLDSEVGDVIKPLWHVELPTYGSKRLVKYAADTITNSMMANSEFSEISMYHMFKKMTNISWEGLYWSNQKNLFNLYKHRANNPKVDFSDITQKSGPLYYSLGNRTFQIIGMGFKDGVYYTEELEVTVLRSNKSVTSVENSYVVYNHYFDNEGNHYKIKLGDPVPDGLHTIDSIYELHKVFGGIASKSFVNGEFTTSEASIRATAALLNMVSEPTQKHIDVLSRNEMSPKDIPLTQEYYYQPLKYKMIDYLINQSAIKNGYSNMNESSAYNNPNNELNDITNDSPLRYVEMDTLRYGIQLDTEHEADEEELTEMSQVISAIDAGGYYHNEVVELYKAIGYLALKASEVELNKVKQFLKTNDPNILYDSIGRTLIEHMSLDRGRNGIAEALLDRISKSFGSSTDHTLDEIAIAFSDQAIYNKIISTIASILNKKSVKRKFPGTGQVMAPGYNIVLLWKINGEYSKYEDLVKQAQKEGFTSDSNIPDQYNRDIVKLYLAAKQSEHAAKYTKTIPMDIVPEINTESFWEEQLRHINPIDIIQCTVDGKALKPIKLDEIHDYYLFKNNPLLYLLDKGLITELPKQSISVVKRIDIPSNLAPTEYTFTYIGGDGKHHRKNVYDIWAVKDMYFALEDFKRTLPPTMSKYHRDKEIERKKIELRRTEQEVLAKLDLGIFLELVDGKLVERKIIGYLNNPALTVMSNIYKSKFDILTGESLYDILKQGPSRFEKSPLKILPQERVYDLAILNSNGKGVLISFDDEELQSVEGFYKVKGKRFLNISEHVVVQKDNKYYDEYTDEEIKGKTLDGRIIHSYIYSLDSNNSEIIPIGIKVDVSDKIEFNGENFIYKDSKKLVTEDIDLTIKGNKVLLTIQFVNRKLISPKYSKKYSIYNIKSKLLSSLLGEDYVKNIVSKLYELDNYTYIMPARYVNKANISYLKAAIESIKDTTGDKDIKSYLLAKGGFLGALHHVEESEEEGLVKISGYNTILKEYNKKLALKVYNSFKESLYFISSRIPAQSLQSFMKMQVVAFTASDANIAYVSHWQTWLQGSDYDIDKSYMLGNEFDNNGLYLGWSPLFDFDYIDASKNLPFPSGVEVDMPKEDGVGVSIENFVDRYLAIEKNDIESKINLYSDLIKFINQLADLDVPKDESGKILIANSSGDEKQKTRRELVRLINKHNSYIKGLDVTENALKNFISNKLQKIILGSANLIGSHAPITIEYLHEAADGSSYKPLKWTSANPGYIPHMQTQAMTGKKGVGIAANGQKAGFIWKYWMTDSINNNNKYKEFVNFPLDFHIDRIEGRFGVKYGDKIVDKRIRRLPDVNMYNASEEDKIFYEFNENHYIPSDQMSSLMISAATDNAKELILDVINANTDLAKVYMYLITIGFDVKDIVSFMTSPAINLIARSSTQNIFLGTNFRTKDVANYILNIIDKKLTGEYGKRSTYSIDAGYSFVLDNKINSLLESIENNASKTKTKVFELLHQNAIMLGVLDELLLNIIDSEDLTIIEGRLRESGFSEELIAKAINELNSILTFADIKLDIEEFMKIYSLSEEFSYLGRFLGINGGIATDKEKLMSFKKFIKDLISLREVEMKLKEREKGRFKINEVNVLQLIPEELTDLVNNVDVDLFLRDEEYRLRVMRYYELIKGSCNIIALVESADLFKSILDVYNALNIYDGQGVAKSKATDLIFNKITEKFPYTSIDYAMQILPILNLIYISSFVELNPVEIPVQVGWKYLNEKWQIKTINENGTFTIGGSENMTSDASLVAFHYMMDNHIIPTLKNGESIYGLTKEDGEPVDYEELKKNAFILNLIPIVDKLEVRYKINIDMRAALSNAESKIILNSIIKGLRDLEKYRFGNRNLLDIFMLYSLKVDQNKQGSDRLTDLFSSFADGENLLIDYYKYMGKIELNNSEFIKKIDKLSVNGFLIALANLVSSERGHNEPSLKLITEDGDVKYMFNQGFLNYRSFGDFLPIIPLESTSDKLLRKSLREQYKFGLVYDVYIVDLLDKISDFSNPDAWTTVFKDLITGGYIKTELNCG